jgi:hypothetical protein
VIAASVVMRDGPLPRQRATRHRAGPPTYACGTNPFPRLSYEPLRRTRATSLLLLVTRVGQRPPSIGATRDGLLPLAAESRHDGLFK